MIMNQKEAAAHYKISAATLRRWENHGLPVIKIPGMANRYDIKKIDEWLDGFLNTGISDEKPNERMG